MDVKHIIMIKSGTDCGKDEAANYIEKRLDNYGTMVRKYVLSEPLKKLVMSILDIDEETYEKYKKNNTKVKINNYTIGVRNFIKKTAIFFKSYFGESYFIDIVIKNIENSNADIFIIPDLRFYKEYEKIKEFCDKNEYNLHVLFMESDLPNCRVDDVDKDNIPSTGIIKNIYNDISHLHLTIENYLIENILINL